MIISLSRFVAGYPKGLELYRGVRLYIQSTANTIIVYDNNRQCVVSRYINTRGRINFFYPRRHSPVVVIKSNGEQTSTNSIIQYPQGIITDSRVVLFCDMVT